MWPLLGFCIPGEEKPATRGIQPPIAFRSLSRQKFRTLKTDVLDVSKTFLVGKFNLRGNLIFSLGTSIKRAACLLGLLVLAACSSTGQTSTAVEKSVAIPSNSTAFLLVKARLKKDHRYKERVLETVSQQLSSGLVEQGVFRSVSTAAGAAPAAYTIDLTVNRIRVVTPGGRVMFGFMAGRNKVGVHVVVRSTASGKTVTEFDALGSGASIGWGRQSYGADDPVREVVERVIEKLQ